ncbi:MAG: twin-arginine translocase TatA/TatE family subunit [Proteobacteria bacterium]|nr:twin-arginine translocase TatA/TatE family subunit [Pseudomonadota bacterium]MBU1581622.1 twin-arginine translocase TatA/TatE family subunit [Pseudomonadota bacterium]MBU2451911.1 twin-arginine translocase TatA/TatE family subunit [Pseudomonadota bacterium]MBU2631921.1 twin-arginine translocase TatA/TatE family subunit [Pseudomonadota bacterium]
MFGLGMPEILLILAIALIVIGPKKLPDLAKTLGRAMGEFKRSAQDFKRSIDIETTVKDMKDIEDPKTDLKAIFKDANINPETPSDSKTDSDFKTPGKDVPDNNGETSPKDKEPDKTDNSSEKHTTD